MDATLDPPELRIQAFNPPHLEHSMLSSHAMILGAREQMIKNHSLLDLRQDRRRESHRPDRARISNTPTVYSLRDRNRHQRQRRGALIAAGKAEVRSQLADEGEEEEEEEEVPAKNQKRATSYTID
jgi:hypothetical protein